MYFMPCRVKVVFYGCLKKGNKVNEINQTVNKAIKQSFAEESKKTEVKKLKGGFWGRFCLSKTSEKRYIRDKRFCLRFAEPFD